MEAEFSKRQPLPPNEQPYYIKVFTPRISEGLFEDIVMGLESHYEESLSEEEKNCLFHAVGHLTDEELINVANVALSTLDPQYGFPSIQWFIYQADFEIQRSFSPKIHIT